MGQAMGCTPVDDKTDNRETSLNPVNSSSSANSASTGNGVINNQYNDDIDDIKNNNNPNQYYAILNLQEENKELKGSNDNLNSKVSKLEKELDEWKEEKTQLNDQIIQLQSKINGKKKKIKKKLDKIDIQIEILNSEKYRMRSLLFCCKISSVSSKQYSFIEFLEKHMNNKIAQTLFNKIKSDQMNSSQLSNVLTYTATIYVAKLHQAKYGKNMNAAADKSVLNPVKIRQSVQHLSVWIIRNYGRKLNQKDIICVYDDDGNQIKGEYNLYDITVTKTEYPDKIKKWVKSYVDNDGQMIPIIFTDHDAKTVDTATATANTNVDTTATTT